MLKLLLGLLVVLLLSLQPNQPVLRLQVHFIVVALRQHSDHWRQLLLQQRHVIVTHLLGPVLLVFPEGRRVELLQARWLYVAVAAEAVESLPVFPSRFPNEVVWVHAGRPVAEMRDLWSHWPSILVAGFLSGGRRSVEHFSRDFVSTEPSRSIFSFLTIVGMRKNATGFKHEEAFLAYRVERVYVLWSLADAFCLDLVGPIQEDGVVLLHLLSHFYDSSSR